ncbi:MAG: alpha/beta hydrolase [Janthinobacterium lividum]
MSRAPVVLAPGVVTQLAPAQEWLDSWWLVAGLGAGLLVLLAVAAPVPGLRRRAGARRPPGVRAGLVAGSVVLLLLTGAETANALSGYLPTLGAARFVLTGSYRSGTGTLTKFSLGAPTLDVPASTTYAYLPPGYSPTAARRYPVAYLFHGSPGRSSDWFAAGDAARTLDVLIAHHEIPPMIVVTPDTNGGGLHDTECLNRPHGAQLETFINHVLVPAGDARFRTDPRPAARVMGGMSAGGFCALDQGLRHRETWGPIIALEPFGDPGNSFRDRLGVTGFAAVSPSAYLPRITVPAPVPVFYGTGARAIEKPGVDIIGELLTSRGWPVLRRDVPGQGHTWLTARADLPYGLVYAARFLPRE